MNQFRKVRSLVRKLFLGFVGLFIFTMTFSQNPDTIKNHLYNPNNYPSQDTTPVIDSREQFIRDSIAAREKFIQDSIAVRLKFIQDSIARRQRMHDSVVFLKKELPKLLEASLKTISDQIVAFVRDIPVIGDSMLGNFTYGLLPFSLEQPFTPWKPNVSLTGKSIKFKSDKTTQKVISMQVPFMTCSFGYGNNLIIINEQSAVLNNRWGNYYKMPIDSVFYDKSGRVAKIKRYVNFYQASATYQKGAFLFTHLSEVKQFEYNTSNQISKFQVVSFCDRWKAADPKKVCNIANYTITKQGNNYLVNRQNDPRNNFSDGNFTSEFDENHTLKSLAFTNASKTEEWTTFVELNEAGDVSRYIYKVKGVVNKTLLVNYYLNDPKAPFKVETITCIFEDDNISYWQQNNMTGKVRERSRVTGEWGPWK